MKEKELQLREFDLLKRELNIMMLQQQQTPTPNRRKGKFKRKKLLSYLKKESSPNISSPSGEYFSSGGGLGQEKLY